MLQGDGQEHWFEKIIQPREHYNTMFLLFYKLSLKHWQILDSGQNTHTHKKTNQPPTQTKNKNQWHICDLTKCISAVRWKEHFLEQIHRLCGVSHCWWWRLAAEGGRSAAKKHNNNITEQIPFTMEETQWKHLIHKRYKKKYWFQIIQVCILCYFLNDY